MPENQYETVHTDRQLTLVSGLRCLLALVCSHIAAPYPAARLTIRYQLQGDFELQFALITVISMGIGSILAFRQLVDLPVGRKCLFSTIGFILWVLVAFVLLNLAVHSEIPVPVLGILWTGGTIWIAWTVWAFSLFRSTGVILGSVLVGLITLPFWGLVEATGLRGNTRVEFEWRRAFDGVAVTPKTTEISRLGTVTWPGYLGNTRDGVVSDTMLRDEWDIYAPEPLWEQSCGGGWSSFAATETSLFCQEQLSTGDCVTARDLHTGELLWATPQGTEQFCSGLGGNGPRATPAICSAEGEDRSGPILFAVGPSGVLSCLKADSGAIRWTRDLRKQFPGKKLIHGACCSPLVVNNLIVVAPPTASGPGLAAFNVADGTLEWQCSSSWPASYASPSLMTVCDQLQIVFHAGPGVMGVDPSDGRMLWQYQWTNEWNNNATQPLQLIDQPNDLFVATGYQGGVARISISANESGGLQAREIWVNRKTMKTKFCSMAQFGETLVGLDNGILCGINAETGKRLWKKGRYGHGQILQIGKHLLIVEEKGDIRILKPDRKGDHPVGNGVAGLTHKAWSHPILIHDRLIVRNDQKMICMRLSIEPTSNSDEQTHVDSFTLP
ncbi:MAG: PQQ-like beta-propeller repeat protein [Fuerstiella sp.]|nr:PQQ-like beta-propeller repeat protein [Fuerstiella sp.]